MSKILKNQTVSDVPISDMGITVTASGEYILDHSEYLMWQGSSDVIVKIADGTLVVNDGSDDLSLSNGIDLIKGSYNPNEVDSEGRQIVRMAAGKKGWTYLSHPIDISISELDGVYSADYTGTVRTDLEIQLYDINDALITTQAAADTDCVKSVITFKPLYDFEVIAGTIHQCNAITDDIRMWVIGGAFVEATNTPVSVKEFATGINLKHIGTKGSMETDGRASKKMTKDITEYGLPFPTYQGNCFQIIIRHPAGKKHNVMVMFEYYRE